MKKIMILFAALLVMAGCEKPDDCLNCGKKEQPEQEEKQESRAVFTFNTATATVITSRSVNENETGAVHLFLFGAINYYFLVEQGKNTLTTEVLAGDYDVYAVTNCSSVHAGMSKAELESLTFNGVEQDGQGRILMSCKERIQVKPGEAFSQTLELVRGVAKAAFTVNVAEGCDVELIGYLMCNIPDKGNLFAAEGDAAKAIHGAVYSNTALTELNNVKTFQQTFYLPENHQGQVAGTEKDRTRPRAPENATCLLIRGRSGGNPVDYWVFLGNNGTDDYNVTRNNSYVYNVTIVGANNNDFRVSSYRPSVVYPTTERIQLNEDGSFYQGISIPHTPKFSYRYFDVEVICEHGEWEYLTMNDMPFINGRCDLGRFDATSDYGSWNPSITRKDIGMLIYYQPELFTPENRDLILRFIVTDEFGYSTELTAYRLMANRVRLRSVADYGLSFTCGNNDIGWSASTGYIDHYIGDDNRFYLSAKQGAPFTQFVGWYTDPELTQLYSTDNPFYYVPQKRHLDLYYKYR